MNFPHFFAAEVARQKCGKFIIVSKKCTDQNSNLIFCSRTTCEQAAFRLYPQTSSYPVHMIIPSTFGTAEQEKSQSILSCMVVLSRP